MSAFVLPGLSQPVSSVLEIVLSASAISVQHRTANDAALKNSTRRRRAWSQEPGLSSSEFLLSGLARTSFLGTAHGVAQLSNGKQLPPSTPVPRFFVACEASSEKSNIYRLVASTNRGKGANSAQRTAVKQAVELLEAKPVFKNTAFLDGTWTLVYVSSDRYAWGPLIPDAPFVDVGTVETTFNSATQTVVTKVPAFVGTNILPKTEANVTATISYELLDTTLMLKEEEASISLVKVLDASLPSPPTLTIPLKDLTPEAITNSLEELRSSLKGQLRQFTDQFTGRVPPKIRQDVEVLASEVRATGTQARTLVVDSVDEVKAVVDGVAETRVEETTTEATEVAENVGTAADELSTSAVDYLETAPAPVQEFAAQTTTAVEDAAARVESTVKESAVAVDTRIQDAGAQFASAREQLRAGMKDLVERLPRTQETLHLTYIDEDLAILRGNGASTVNRDIYIYQKA